MSEGVRTSPRGGGFRFKVRGPRAFYGGLALIALAIVAIWTSGDLPGTHGFAFGPGTAPRLFAGLLAVVGALVALTGLLFDGPPIEKYAVRGPAWVILAILAFAGMIRGINRRAAEYPAPWAGAVDLCRLLGLHLRLDRDALVGKPDRCGGDDSLLRWAVRLSAATAVPALALDLSRKPQS